MNNLSSIPDTRPYPQGANKNELLAYADTIVQAASPARMKLAEEQLCGELAQMLANNHYLSFSVALSLAPSAAHYRVLWQALIEQLCAQDNQVQWLALPVVLVCGAVQDQVLPAHLPLMKMKDVFAQYAVFSPLNQANWLPFLVDGEALSDVDAGAWFAAKDDLAGTALQARFQAANMAVASGQSVAVFYALCFGGNELSALAARAMGEMALPLMQVFQEALSVNGLTVFANPLHLNVPAAALAEGSEMRQRMACDVFIANAIRSIRLQYPRVGVVIAAGEGGVIYFSLQAQEMCEGLSPLVFTWHLSSGEEVAQVVQNVLDLLMECHVEHVRILQRVVSLHTLPFYVQAAQEGFNPFFAEERTFNA